MAQSDFVAADPRLQTGASETGYGKSRWVLVICLTVVSMLALIDKNVMTLFVGGVKATLGLSDTQMGLVMGAAFALANLAVSVPCGWLADKADRRAIVAAGIVVWSIMAALCGAAGGFWQLFFTRAGVGLGEGAIPPASYSLIRDAVPPDLRGRAFSVYGMAASVGSGLALVIGGALVGLIAASGIAEIPIVGQVAPWQLALIAIGICGLPFVLLAYAFRDPGRGQYARAAGATFAETWILIKERLGVLVALLIFSVMHAMLAAAIASWLPALLGRDFGLKPQVVGPLLGGLLIVAAPIGLGSAGWIMDAAQRKSRAGPALAALLGGLLLLVSATLMPRAPSLTIFWALETVVILTSTIYFSVTSTVVSHVMPARAIGKTMSLFLLIQGVTGAGLAPVTVALVSDHVFGGAPHALANALSLAAALFGGVALLAAVWLYVALRTLPANRFQ